MAERFYTTEEIADMFKVSVRTVREWLRTGVIKGRRIGRRWYVPEEEILRIKEEVYFEDPSIKGF